MAVAMPVRSRKQSDRAAATLYSPPETWISTERALRKGTTPGSSRWTSAPRARKSRSQGSLRTWKAFICSFLRGWLVAISGGASLRRPGLEVGLRLRGAADEPRHLTLGVDE